MKRMSGKVAVVTGGNSGIGLAAARAFVREGARVAIFGRNAETLQAAVSELNGDGGAIAIQGDVTNDADLERLFDEVRERFGGVDALFVNAGVAMPSSFEDTSAELFDRHFDINVKGAYFTVQRALPLLNKGASVVLTTSAGNQLGMPNMSAYLATKAALRSLARTLSAELVGRGIRVNAISPGPIETPIFGRLEMPQEQMAAMAEQITGMIPAGRFGQADEIAEAVVFLASSESSYVLGAELVVDGGMSQL